MNIHTQLNQLKDRYYAWIESRCLIKGRGTKTALAHHVGVHKQYFNDMVKRRFLPKPDLADKIEEFLK